MTASKENARAALEVLEKHGNVLPIQVEKRLREFLEAALKRLPSESTISRDKEKRKQRNKTKKVDDIPLEFTPEA